MPEEKQEPSVDDAVRMMLDGLPTVIREFVMGPERDRIALQLMQKYGLHVDQGGSFQLAYLQMLLGAISPEEFSKNLRGAGISEETVRGLTVDVNEMVFKPLREKERTAGEGSQTARAAAPSVPAPAPSLPPLVPPRTAPPAPSYHPEAPAPVRIQEPVVPAPFTPVPPQQVQAPAPMHAPEPVPTSFQKQVPPPENLPGAFAPQPAPPQTVHPVFPSTYTPTPASPVSHSAPQEVSGTLRTMQSDILAVNEHHEPVPRPYHETVSAPSLPERPLPQPQMPASAPAPRPSVTPSPDASRITEYSTDPYREPIT